MAEAVLVLCAVIAVGLTLGSLKVRGLGFGVAGVLFAGLAFGHFGLNIESGVRTFLQEFGLILFVYTIGMQLGPGFLDSLRRQGLPLNLMAAAVVLLGGAGAALLIRGLDLAPAVGIGILCGAVTNTPSLGAAQQALAGLPKTGPETLALPGLGYAVAYPFGVIGIILSMLALRGLFRIDVARERESYAAAQRTGQEAPVRQTLEITNPNLAGLTVARLPGLGPLGIVISRHKPAAATEVSPVGPETVLQVGDLLTAIGLPEALRQFQLIVGRASDQDLLKLPGPATFQRVILTRRSFVGKTLRAAALEAQFGVSITRLTRSDLEIAVHPDLRLQFGDMLHLVGTRDAVARAAEALGNSIKELNHAQLVPIFVGIALGVLLGSYSFHLPHVPAPVRLGLAGGPLLVAIVLSRLGRIGPFVWYLPTNANLLLRELGIALFLACVGLKSGERFVETLRAGDGLLWMAAGAALTVGPLLLVAVVARLWRRTNFTALCGLMAGSMTDPPALAFAHLFTGSEAPAVAYAAVYPLTMILRIVVAQLLVLFLV